MASQFKKFTGALVIFLMVSSSMGHGGQVPVVRPANLGISSPTLPSSTVSTSVSTPTFNGPPTSTISAGVTGTTVPISGIAETITNNETGLTGFASPTVIDSTIEQLNQMTNSPNVTITDAQRAGITRTIKSVLINVEMTPAQRVQLINVREQIEHSKP